MTWANVRDLLKIADTGEDATPEAIAVALAVLAAGRSPSDVAEIGVPNGAPLGAPSTIAAAPRSPDRRRPLGVSGRRPRARPRCLIAGPLSRRIPRRVDTAFRQVERLPEDLPLGPLRWCLATLEGGDIALVREITPFPQKPYAHFGRCPSSAASPFAAPDEFVADARAGYVIVTGGSTTGNTAFMAEVAARNGWSDPVLSARAVEGARENVPGGYGCPLCRHGGAGPVPRGRRPPSPSRACSQRSPTCPRQVQSCCSSTIWTPSRAAPPAPWGFYHATSQMASS
jgi:hypothetical protein